MPFLYRTVQPCMGYPIYWGAQYIQQLSHLERMIGWSQGNLYEKKTLQNIKKPFFVFDVMLKIESLNTFI